MRLSSLTVAHEAALTVRFSDAAGAVPLCVTRSVPVTPPAVAAAEGHEDYRLVFNTGEGVGQSVFHAHVHLLAGRAMTWPPG